MTEQLESIPNNKYFFRWNFAEDDWLIDILLNDKVIRHQLFIVKNYNLYKINDCIYELLNKIQKYRTELELNSQTFINKKKYLTLFKNDNKIQISLEEEYLLKELIEQYKIYEAICWFHIGKNNKIVKIKDMVSGEEKIIKIDDL